MRNIFRGLATIGKIVLAIPAIFIGIMIPQMIRDAIWMPEVTLLSASGEFAAFAIIVAMEIPILFLFGAWIKRIRIPMEGKGVFLSIATVVWCGLMYYGLTNTTYVTEDQIIHHSWLHPKARIYKYSDVTAIDCGFGQSRGSIYPSKKRGNFYYRIKVQDGWINLSDETGNPEIERYEDTYLELEEFDQALMEFRPEKTGSEAGAKYCYYDQHYVDRYLRIIRNDS